MAFEIEAKLRVDDHAPVRARLQELGAQHLGTGLETNFIMDKPDGSLRRAGIGTRVRQVLFDGDRDPVATMTVKGPRLKGALKAREERETSVGNAHSAVAALELLGLVVILEYEKRRESWSIQDCRVELDTPPAIGQFVEIEGPGEREILAVRQLLALDGAALESKSYPHLLIKYCEQQRLTDRRLSLHTTQA